MRAVILAGGLGTRLRPYTTVIPKPLVPIGERPVLQHIIERLTACDVTHVDLCVNYLGRLIRTYFTHADDLPENLTLAWHWEDRPLGTAGALGVVPDLNETFIAMNGDILTTLDYRDLVTHHKMSGAAVTVATLQKPINIDLGVIEAANGRVTAYREKPTLHYDVSMGVYVYEPRALSYLPDGECQFPELVQLLLDAGEKVGIYRSSALWYDIGTPSEYERAVADTTWLAPAAPTRRLGELSLLEGVEDLPTVAAAGL